MNTAAAATGAPVAGSATATPTQPGSRSSALGDENTFLKLMVAQLKNQNPLNPADGVQFLTQLSQFSSLEQLIQVRQNLEAIRTELVPRPVGSPAGETAPASPSNP